MTTRYRQDKNNKTKKYPSYANAILNINANAEFSMEYDESDNPKWDTLWFGENTTPISQEDIENKYQELKTNWEKGNYIDERVKSYPSIEEQMDMQYWDSVNGTTTWADAIAKVKADNPKSE
jgi:hypothetical protein|tara:strand:- start:291 stop:656 length:366 start_codon:yes stop_codon:yes gene_type:complete